MTRKFKRGTLNSVPMGSAWVSGVHYRTPQQLWFYRTWPINVFVVDALRTDDLFIILNSNIMFDDGRNFYHVFTKHGAGYVEAQYI